MKRVLAAMVVALAAGQSASAQNLLSNPDLDVISVSSQLLATPSNWVAASSRTNTGVFNDGLSSEGFANWQQGGGQGVFFKPFQGQLSNGNRVTSSISQDVPATPGASYTLSGWAGAGAGYIGLSDGSVRSEFVLQFLDGSNTVIGSSVINLVANGLGVPNGNPFGYKQFSVTGIAPGGAVTVRSIAQMVDAYGNPAGGDQAFVVDSFSLIPAPSAMALLGLGGLVATRRRR